MSALRLLLAWLIIAAVPLQGFAASSMAFCKGDHHGAASSQEAERGTTRLSAHDHASHSHGVEAQVDETQSTDAKLPDAAHKCGVCASCCYSFGVAQLVHWPALAPAPQAALAEPFLVILTTPASVLDKPPRA
jgi:hypothetical protein